MGTRLELDEELRKLSDHVYFQPPSTIKMTYPCIVYHLSGIDSLHANNKNYKNFMRYTLTYICQRPDESKVHEILGAFSMSRFDRTYASDNLQHYIFTLYY